MRLSTLGLIFVTFAALIPHSLASIIFYDDFNSNSGQMSATGMTNSSSTGSFTVTGGNVDLVGPAFFSNLCNAGPESGSCVDMDGTTIPGQSSNAGQITSTMIALAPGGYFLSFDIFGSQRGVNTSTSVALGPFYNHVFNLASDDQEIVLFHFFVPEATTAQLIFTSNDSADSLRGALIDNVQISSNPEPASAFLLVAALPLAWIMRRRRVL